MEKETLLTDHKTVVLKSVDESTPLTVPQDSRDHRYPTTKRLLLAVLLALVLSAAIVFPILFSGKKSSNVPPEPIGSVGRATMAKLTLADVCNPIAGASQAIDNLFYLADKCADVTLATQVLDGYLVMLESATNDAKAINTGIDKVTTSLPMKILGVVLAPMKRLKEIVDRLKDVVYNLIVPPLNSFLTGITPLNRVMKMANNLCASKLVKRLEKVADHQIVSAAVAAVSYSSTACSAAGAVLQKRQVQNPPLTLAQLEEFYNILKPFIDSLQVLSAFRNNGPVDVARNAKQVVDNAWNQLRGPLASTRDAMARVRAPVDDLIRVVIDPIQNELNKQTCVTNILNAYYTEVKQTSCPSGWYLTVLNKCERRAPTPCPAGFGYDLLRGDCWTNIDSTCEPGYVNYLSRCYKQCHAGFDFRRIGELRDYMICDPAPECISFGNAISKFIDDVSAFIQIIFTPINLILDPVINGILSTITIPGLSNIQMPSIQVPNIPDLTLFDPDNLGSLCSRISSSTATLPEPILKELRIMCPNAVSLIPPLATVRVQLGQRQQFLSISEIIIEGPNIVRRTVTASSISPIHGNRNLDTVRNNITDGNWFSAYQDLTSTNQEDYPWMEMKFEGRVADVTSVKVYGRTDCCFDRMNSLTVLLIDPAGASTLLSLASLNAGSQEFTFTRSGLPPAFVPPTQAIAGTPSQDYLLLVLPGAGRTLSVTEVVVQSMSNPINRLRAIASTAGWDRDPSLAINGVINGAWGGGDVTHTATETNPWLRVYLSGDIANMGSVIVYGRTDCCTDRIQGLRVYLVSGTTVVKTLSTMRTVEDRQEITFR